jgi:hypothetical protein
MLKLNTCILQQYFIRVCKRIIEAICSFSRSSSSLRENGLYPKIHWLNNYASRRSCTCVRVDESICPYLYKHRTQLQGVGKYHCWAISVWNNILVVFFFLPYKMVDNPAFSAMFSACSHTDQVPDGSTAYKKRK